LIADVKQKKREKNSCKKFTTPTKQSETTIGSSDEQSTEQSKKENSGDKSETITDTRELIAIIKS